MKLTGNEKKIVKLLLKNARTTDSDIALALNISSQAVGKIRKKLETKIIKKYTLELDYSKFGINIFALVEVRLKTKYLLKNIKFSIEKKILDDPHVIQFYRIPQGKSTHIILYGFENMKDLDSFFYSENFYFELDENIDMLQTSIFSDSSLLKNSSQQLFEKFLENKLEKKPFLVSSET